MIAKSMRNLPKGRDFGVYFKPSINIIIHDTSFSLRFRTFWIGTKHEL